MSITENVAGAVGTDTAEHEYRALGVPPTMRAAILPGVGEPLRVETIATPRPRAGEVLVRVAACGVCHTDLHVMRGEVPFVTPAVLGHEISGEIVALGAGVSEHAELAVGMQVVCGFIMPCGQCRACARGRDDLCHDFFAKNRLRGVLYDGHSRLHDAGGEEIAMYSMGGLAEYAVVPATGVTALPDGLPVEESAVLGCAALTAYGAVRRTADLRFGETVAVVAMGGVGSNIVQMARAFGAARVIAVDISSAALETARGLGATDVVDASSGDPVAQVRALTGGQGVDVVFEALGLPSTFRQASDMLADGGRMVAVGIADGAATADVEITRLVRRSQRILGSYGARTRTDLRHVAAMAGADLVRPHETVTTSYPLADVDRAYRALADGEIVGRAVIRMGSASSPPSPCPSDPPR
ncbi:zinc-binding dehydrogenase [Ruania alkalisoli]|uniref:Zinc-binding dehydrogenase n=1 Tax=Ruania alkalisoli TaxID=2779775 RepID=A0A7M1SY17_9MICO|nr:zinc-binding dehydrogenase [Ruania alkalisoli]QOR71632.1 zinc-binding dehydrogenase [Ruania alkalisoli]